MMHRAVRPIAGFALGAWCVLAVPGLAPCRADVPLPPTDEGARVDPATFDIPQIQGAYRKVLSRWAAGGGGDALADLVSLESGVVGKDGGGLSRLFKAEMQSVRELQAVQPESLLPVLLLHHDTYADYRSRGNPYLTVHARNLVQTVAEIYAGRSDAAGKASAARVLVSLGGYLQEASLSGFAANLYARGLEFDPRNDVALLGLGALFEKSGQYEPAAKYFSRLVEADPANAEGRLRLALTWLRGGRRAEGRAGLESLLGPEVPGWIANLAHGELAVVYSEAGDHRRARELLERAVARFPGDARLRVQLAATLERLGQPGAALAAAEAAIALPAETGDGSRLRYTRWQPDMLLRMRDSLRRSSEERLSVLAQALAVPAGHL